MGNQVTSIKIDEDVWKEAKKKAIDEGISLQEFLSRAIKFYMGQSKKKLHEQEG